MQTSISNPAPGAAAPVRRLAFTALITLVEAGHLAWEHAHGGIVSHHLLNDPTLPALWNGWGLVVLPLLAWLASKRLFGTAHPVARLPAGGMLRLTGALSAGLALSIAFSTGSEEAAGAVFLAIVLSALVVRAYRIEYLLGLTIGMAFTFGGLLPVLIGGAIALVSAFAWRGVYPLLSRALGALRA